MIDFTLWQTCCSAAVDQYHKTVLQHLWIRDPLPIQPIILINQITTYATIFLYNSQLPLCAFAHHQESATSIASPSCLFRGSNGYISCGLACHKYSAPCTYNLL